MFAQQAKTCFASNVLQQLSVLLEAAAGATWMRTAGAMTCLATFLQKMHSKQEACFA